MINDLLMMSACYCTKSCQYHIKYPIHVYSDVIQRASYLDLELYLHSWRISALQTWLHHFFCCFDVFRMITMKTWLNAPGVMPALCRAKWLLYMASKRRYAWGMLETGLLSPAVIGMGYGRGIANISRISQPYLSQRLAPMPVVTTAVLLLQSC